MSDNFTTFYIVRHGQTENNVRRIVQGHNDSPLTEEAHQEIKKLAERFRRVKFDLAFSSDLLRAKRTAEIIALEHDLTVQTHELLRERHFGRFEGQTFEALDAYYSLIHKLSDQERFSYEGGEIESDEKVTSRMNTFLRETAIVHPGKTVLVGTHGSMIRAFLIHLGYATYHNLDYGAVKNLAWFRLETDGVDFFVKETEGVILK